MKNKFKLTLEQKKMLKDYGYSYQDIGEIAHVVNHTRFITSRGEELTPEKALELLGEEKFLTGIGHSAFHWVAYREVPNEKMRITFRSENWKS